MKNEKGFSLVEVLIALALLGIIAAAFLGGIATASKAILIADKRTTAESLARSQMEYIKNYPYDDINNPPQYEVDPELVIPDGYNIYITAVRLDPKEDGTDNDDGIQEITVVIYHPYDPINPDENIVITLEDYKVDR